MCRSRVDFRIQVCGEHSEKVNTQELVRCSSACLLGESLALCILCEHLQDISSLVGQQFTQDTRNCFFMFFLGEFKPTILLYKITIYRPIENTFNYDSKAKNKSHKKQKQPLTSCSLQKGKKSKLLFFKTQDWNTYFQQVQSSKQVSECICQKVIERPFKTQIRFYYGLLQVATYSVDCQSNHLLEDLGTTLKIKIQVQ